MKVGKVAVSLAVALVSISAHANVVECSLNNWCALPRTSDEANFPVTRQIGKSYRCTLVVDGKQNGTMVLTVLSGKEGYKYDPIQFYAPQGRSAIVDVKGEFNSTKKGKINIRRMVLSTSSENANVMCEKLRD